MLRNAILLLAMLNLMVACNRQSALNTTENEDLTEKAGDSARKSAKKTVELKTYPDLQPVREGEMLSGKELANKICYCSFDIIRMNEDIQRYSRNNDRQSLQRAQRNVNQAYAKFDRCMAELKAEYPRAVAENHPDKVAAELKKQCPGLLEIMEAGSRGLK